MMPNDPPVGPRKSPPVLWIVLGVLAVCGCGGVAVLAAVLFPVFSQAKHTGNKTRALTNAKQAALGVLMYASDWDERLPLEGKWMDATTPYTKNEDIYKSIAAVQKDPSAYGFAFRLELVGKKHTTFTDAAQRAMIFDSTRTERNATAGLETLPVPGRYLHQNIIAFLDGHAKAVRDADVGTKGFDGKPEIR